MKRRMLRAAVAAVALAATLALVGLLVLRSHWFARQIHDRLVEVVETATGGRVEMGEIEFDWRTMHARVAPFVLHGTEAAGKPPLFQAASIGVGLKIISLARRDVDLRELVVTAPRIYLIVNSDGSTNIPGPKNPNPKRRTVTETILDLAVGRVQIDRGEFQVEGQAPEPFSARAENLRTQLRFDGSAPRYRGELAMDPLEVHWPGLDALPAAAVQLSLTVERNRIQVTGGRFHNGQSDVTFSGGLESLAAPEAHFQIDAHLSVPELARLVKIPELRGGTIQVTGSASWTQPAGAALAGRMHATAVTYRDAHVALRNFRVDGSLEANPRGIDLRGARLAGICAPSAQASVPVDGTIAKAALRGRDLSLDGVSLAALGGDFHGTARLRDLRDYHVEGQITGFRAHPVVALYSTAPLPWDAQASGTVALDGTLGAADRLRVSGQLEIAPAPEGAPVHGHISAAYTAATEVLDLGRSTLSLPASRVDFSGALDSQLHVHLETKDGAELLPAIGQSAASIPVKLENGSAVFDGNVTGKVEQANIAGHLRVANAVYEGRHVDSFEGDVAAAPDAVRVVNGSASLGSVRVRLEGQVGLRDWAAGDASPVTASASVTAASIPDALPVAKVPLDDASGALSAAVQVSGTLGAPVLAAQMEATKGAYRGEPFDRFTAQIHSAGNRLEMTSGQIVAGGKQARVTASYDHAAGRFDSGTLHFQVAAEALPLEEIRTLAQARPGLRGTVTVTATGQADLAKSPFRLTALDAEAQGHGLQLTGQTLGDATLTAHSQGQMLRVHLDASFAGSHVLGDGEWRLDGDNPGTATVNFSKLDFAQLSSWIAPATVADKATDQPVAGFAEGQLRIDGPLMQRDKWRAELRVPSFEIRPTENPVPGGVSLSLRNSGPIVARMANAVVTVESAHLVGRSTDLAITGRVALDQKNPLDLRMSGQVDLALLHDFDRDFTSSGVLSTDATVRGSLGDPQIAGRVQFEKASFSLADFPNGVSNANGVIVFTKDRATIQSFSGETGGGKLDLSGFATYAGGLILYRLHARADHVRVRYPEGVSTVANASLSLSGTRDRSVLSGTVTVLRTGFNPQGDFSSLITQSAEPVRTPAAQTGLLGGMTFSVQINTSPDVQFQSALTQDFQMDANLTLRGSPSNPALLGRITITEGQVIFFGTKFNVHQGSISFFNPLKVDPVLNVDLETKERGVDVTLTVSGPLTHPNLTPHSDPPLQFNEIVALLATGEGPSSDPTLLAQQTTAPQSWQQMGASALLGQAIASPVSGRLQRFFGVSRLRIDPTLPGVENNPQARLTLDQQISSSITFTYITNVTNSNPQVVRVEWALSKQWSVVALREENGVFGIDFYLKKRF